jgi:hypothetical protein
MFKSKLWLFCQYHGSCLVFWQVVVSGKWPINYIGGLIAALISKRAGFTIYILKNVHLILFRDKADILYTHYSKQSYLLVQLFQLKGAGLLPLSICEQFSGKLLGLV